MELLRELYIIIYILGDDVEIIKTLRSVCKSSLIASYDYFKILLKQKMIINYSRSQWFVGEKYEVKDLCFLPHVPIPHPILFHITVKDFYNSVVAVRNKEVKFNYS